ncbi:odorant receptor 45b-like [Belonocnema kinseyi]|uniref:odorant receptor 45b-like n=1 Tax=Belonocnema kinseyi TaxID=2817044 RepID=UPI00143CCBCC|nr:odorant receptor 45b-like [Belonocnema kinseyi]
MQNKKSTATPTTCPKTISTTEEDIEYVFKICRTITTTIFLWPNDSSTRTRHVIRFIAKLTVLSLITFGCVNNILQTVLVIRNLAEIMIGIGFINLGVGGALKFLILWIRQKDFETCIRYVKEDWENCENTIQREIMFKYAKKTYYFSFISATIIFGTGVIFFVIKPIAEGVTVTIMNETIRLFPSPTYGDYKVYSPFYEILYLVQTIIIFINFSTNTAAFDIFSLFTIHACGQFELIVFKLNTFLTDASKEQSKLNEKLNLIFKQHLRNLKFIEDLKILVNEFCFIEVVNYIFEICLLSYIIIMIADDTELMILLSFFLTSYIFNIFVYCYVGELLTTKAISVGESAYSSETFFLPKSINLDFIHLIRAAQFPSKIAAGKFFVLSMVTFNTIMRTASVYFNFLLKMTQ